MYSYIYMHIYMYVDTWTHKKICVYKCTYTHVHTYTYVYTDVEMHKVQVEACINRSATQETPPAHPDDRRRVLGAAGNHAAGQ